MGISMSWKAVIPSPLLEDGWGDNLDGDGVKSEQEVARNVVEVETKLLENALLEQKNKPAEQVAVMEPTAGCPRKDKVMDMDALELHSGTDEQVEVGISLKPAGIVGLDVGEDLPSMERVKSGALSSMAQIWGGAFSLQQDSCPCCTLLQQVAPLLCFQAPTRLHALLLLPEREKRFNRCITRRMVRPFARHAISERNCGVKPIELRALTCGIRIAI